MHTYLYGRRSMYIYPVCLQIYVNILYICIDLCMQLNLQIYVDIPYMCINLLIRTLCVHRSNNTYFIWAQIYACICTSYVDRTTCMQASFVCIDLCILTSCVHRSLHMHFVWLQIYAYAPRIVIEQCICTVYVHRVTCAYVLCLVTDI